MSAGNAGNQSGPSGDDPFGYLYRPEGGSGQAPPPPSYNQVRAVGERSYGQQHGYGYPPPQDPHYAAPEAQRGGYAGGQHGGPGAGGPHGPDQGDDPPRRNTLLIGAIAVVTAVVLGVGAAILFSDDESGSPEDIAGTDPHPGGDEPEEEPEPSESPDEEEDEDEEDEEEDDGELPAAELGDLTLSDGATVGNGHVDNARTPDGSYIGGLENDLATVSWTFDFDGTPGTYRVHIGYTVREDQQMSFGVNETPRGDKVEFKDWVNSGSMHTNWTRTYQEVDLEPGQNTVHVGCVGDDSCDVAIDKFEVTPDGEKPDW